MRIAPPAPSLGTLAPPWRQVFLDNGRVSALPI